MSHVGIDIGDRITLRGTFASSAGALTSPTTTTLRLRRPSGATTVFTGGGLTNTGPGIFELVVDVDQEGVWLYRWEGTGAVIAADEGTFVVRSSEFYP